jgi:hypothetical protein
MTFYYRDAQVEDADELLRLYFDVYGRDYPLSLGTDRDVMRSIISHPDHVWKVAVNRENEKITASIVVEVDKTHQIGRIEGMVTHPNFQSHGISGHLLAEVTKQVLEGPNALASVYATVRSTGLGPQIVFLKNHFMPLGIFPNAHRLKEYETLMLLAKFSPGVLEKRKKAKVLPHSLAAISRIIDRQVGEASSFEVVPDELKAPENKEYLDFEIVFAPKLVKRMIEERFADAYDRFYPFHEPNLLIASTNGEVEIFAHLSKHDGYCTIVGLTKPCWELAGRMKPLLSQLRTHGASYLEILISTQHTKSIQALMQAQFLPSALYPAMYGKTEKEDCVVMSRTLQPLDFRNMHMEESFRPFLDQYLELWKKMHLEILEVFHASP